ncbi:hypothetical protein RKD27_003635 [Streptomyces sp. SAI-126]|uniref:hypothetical protein n=1 Tax=Streptomyces sp. SAI-126 TaxID=3377732 RepID=UPI003C7C9F31
MDVDSFEKAASGAIWGNVWHEFCGWSFPHRGWNDMVVPYLTALAQGVQDASDGRPAQVMFFDGPFWIKIHGTGSALQLEPGGEGIDDLSFVTDRESLSSAALDAGRLVLVVCESRGWEDDDVRRLRVALHRLSP